MSKARRWNKSIRKSRWRTHKKWALANGWVEVAENTLVPAIQRDDFPPYVPTHLGGKAEKGRNIKIEKRPSGPPPRGVMRSIRKQAKKENVTIRQFMAWQGGSHPDE